MWWISLILLVFAGIMNSIMDVLKTRFNKSIFVHRKSANWIDPAMSWPNKWKNGKKTEGERFFGSSTLLVWLTDLWHLAKFFMILSISLAIVLYQPIIGWYVDWFILYCSFTVTFELFFSKVLIKT